MFQVKIDSTQTSTRYSYRLGEMSPVVIHITLNTIWLPCSPAFIGFVEETKAFSTRHVFVDPPLALASGLLSYFTDTEMVTVRLIASLRVTRVDQEERCLCFVVSSTILKKLNHQSAWSAAFLNSVSSLCFKHFIWIFNTKRRVSMTM